MQPETENKINTIINKNMKNTLPTMHYHGDKVRTIYLIMAIIMVVGTPLFKYKLLIAQSFAGIVAIVAIAVFAGLTNPKSRWVIVIDLIISICASLIFGYQVIASYNNDLWDLFFLANVALAVLSIFAVYFSSKTLRGHLLYASK